MSRAGKAPYMATSYLFVYRIYLPYIVYICRIWSYICGKSYMVVLSVGPGPCYARTACIVCVLQHEFTFQCTQRTIGMSMDHVGCLARPFPRLFHFILKNVMWGHALLKSEETGSGNT
jgi:hypothetical protein